MKVRSAWVLMLVDDVRDITPSVSRLIGQITDSNFLKKQKRFDMPVLTKPMVDIVPGDLVKLSYFTTEEELNALIEKRAATFGDKGIRYEVLGANGWDLLYEDDDPNLT